MMLLLHTETVIEGAHKLVNYNGKCSALHGHSWKIELWFKGSSMDLDSVGILVDFSIVKELKELLDHKILNDVIVDRNPTAENLTMWIYNWFRDEWRDKKPIQIKVRVYETCIGKETYCECGDFE